MSKKLVAYFSASGTTAQKAKAFAQAAEADLCEIKPEVPYTKKDLNYLNPLSRSTKEMHRKSFRPPIIKDSTDMQAYDVIFVGFPIWWYTVPTIINTFLESYDFSGKRIVLFATSGGSSFGKAVSELKGSAPDASIEEGFLLNGDLSADDLRALAEKY